MTREEAAIKKYYDHVSQNGGAKSSSYKGWGELTDGERAKWLEPEKEHATEFELTDEQTYDLYLTAHTWRHTATSIGYRETGPNGPGLYMWRPLYPNDPVFIAGPDCKV